MSEFSVLASLRYFSRDHDAKIRDTLTRQSGGLSVQQTVFGCVLLSFFRRYAAVWQVYFVGNERNDDVVIHMLADILQRLSYFVEGACFRNIENEEDTEAASQEHGGEVVESMLRCSCAPDLRIPRLGNDKEGGMDKVGKITNFARFKDSTYVHRVLYIVNDNGSSKELDSSPTTSAISN